MTNLQHVMGQSNFVSSFGHTVRDKTLWLGNDC